jgi:hypothetical protein
MRKPNLARQSYDKVPEMVNLVKNGPNSCDRSNRRGDHELSIAEKQDSIGRNPEKTYQRVSRIKEDIEQLDEQIF